MYRLLHEQRILFEGELASLVEMVKTVPPGHYQVVEACQGKLFTSWRLWGMAIHHLDSRVEWKAASPSEELKIPPCRRDEPAVDFS